MTSACPWCMLANSGPMSVILSWSLALLPVPAVQVRALKGGRTAPALLEDCHCRQPHSPGVQPPILKGALVQILASSSLSSLLFKVSLRMTPLPQDAGSSGCSRDMAGLHRHMLYQPPMRCTLPAHNVDVYDQINLLGDAILNVLVFSSMASDTRICTDIHYVATLGSLVVGYLQVSCIELEIPR